MSELKKPPLDEPSEALRQEFCSLIDGAVIDSADELSFPLADGRVLKIGKDTDEAADEDKVYHAAFCERIAGENDKISRYTTFYHVYASGEVMKGVEVEEEKDLAEIEASKQVRLEELGSMDFDDREVLAGFIEKSTKATEIIDSGEDASLMDALLASQKDEEFGLNTVSGIELQSVVEVITERVSAA